MNLINFDKVSFAYNGNIILDEINFSINQGDFIYIVGENGSGKTTFLRGLLGLKKVNSGEIIYSKDLNKNQIGYIPQQKDIKADFPANVMEIVLSGRLNYKKGFFYSSKDKSIAEYNLKKLDILSLRNKPYKYLSGGQQQRVLIARALCATEKLLILDEPDTGLDPEARQELYVLLKHLNEKENITILMVTHDIKQEMINTGKIYRVADGKIAIENDKGDEND